MNVGAIIIIAIAASGILMMRFRKRWLAKINIVFTNRITGLFAGWLPGFGILTHVGRKSGKVYRTPINVFRATNGFVIALTYSTRDHDLQHGGGLRHRMCAQGDAALGNRAETYRGEFDEDGSRVEDIHRQNFRER
jgi:hypothetical protein